MFCTRYTLTELCDTELEYSRALRQLSDILDSLNGKIILNYSDNSEKILDYPKPISDNIKGLQDTLKRIIQFCGWVHHIIPVVIIIIIIRLIYFYFKFVIHSFLYNNK